MKQFLLLYFFAATIPLFSQVPTHFLITTEKKLKSVSDPLCQQIIDETTISIKDEVKRIQKEFRKGMTLADKKDMGFQSILSTAENPETRIPGLALSHLIYRSFIYDDNAQLIPVKAGYVQIIQLSIGEAKLSWMAPVRFEINLSQIEVNPSTSSMLISIKDLNNPEQEAISQKFTLATGMILNEYDELTSAPWMIFWLQFYNSTGVSTWLERNINALEPTLMSNTLMLEKCAQALKSTNYLTNSYLDEAKLQLKTLTQELPYALPIDQAIGVLISKDGQKMSLAAAQKEYSPWDDFSEIPNHIEIYDIIKSNDHWNVYQSTWAEKLEDEADSLALRIRFYSAGYTRIDFANNTMPSFSEENWIANQFNSSSTNYKRKFECKQLKGTMETEELINIHIKPSLEKTLHEESALYQKFYQRTSALDYYYTLNEVQLEWQNILISNPEKTAFIYPVLCEKKIALESDYYHSYEDFKFYVLLKNKDNSYTLYEWYYFNPFTYQEYYHLLRCAETHLSKITNYTAGQDIISDSSFWNNYVFKSTERGYSYLTRVITANESIQITAAQFEAQVADCIHLLTEFDLVDLYPHQLLQIIRCYNTINQKNANISANGSKLKSICDDFNFQGRLNRIQKHNEDYYPNLGVSWKTNLSPNCYYLIK